MIKIYDSKQIAANEIRNTADALETFAKVDEVVKSIIEDVRSRGDAALYDYCKQFDHVSLDTLLVSDAEIESAMESTSKEFIKTLQMAKENIIDFHKRQKRENFMINEKEGIVLGQKIMPIEKAGIYVPGGTASYPSSLLMNALPAMIAGVKEIVMVTPCGEDQKIPDVILAAAKVAGVTKIFKIGGAQAIAALAYGTESVPKVDKIVGPGNIYVATAKRMVYGLVDIDMIAGPSEILIIADAQCNPKYVAADMLSQAEHDVLATAILLTDSGELAEAVKGELEKQLPLLKREEIARQSIEDHGKIIVTDDLSEAVLISNAVAPEHLEICTDDPFALLNSIEHAGSIFLGRNVPEALGDYFAGPNHVLPTGGTARFSSPLGVDDFVKRSSFIYYTKEALGEVQQRIVDFAEKEGLQAHGKSISVRFEEA